MLVKVVLSAAYVAAVGIVAARRLPILRLAQRSGERVMSSGLLRMQGIIWGGVAGILLVAAWLPSHAKAWVAAPLIGILVLTVVVSSIRAGRQARIAMDKDRQTGAAR